MTCKRHILYVAALLALLSVASVGCRDKERKAREAAVVELEGSGPGVRAEGDQRTRVRRVLDADAAYSGQYVQVRYSDATQWLEGHVAYAREMGEISLEGTPEAFSDAFRRHQEAWAAYAAHLRTVPSDRLGMFLDQAEARRPENVDLIRRSAELNQEISASWSEVEMLASTVGVGEGLSTRAPPAPVGSTRKLIGTRR
jgi:hypothetical protein